jgi:hypothetical protein
MNQIHVLTHYLLTTILIFFSQVQLDLSRCLFTSSFMTLMLFGKEYKLRNSSLCNFFFSTLFLSLF